MSEETFSGMAYYAMKRIQIQIDNSVKAAKREISARDVSYAEEHEFSYRYINQARRKSFRYLIPVYAIRLTVRDRDHFYTLVNWFNKNVGNGSQFWSVPGKILKYVDPKKPTYDPPVTRTFMIYVSGIDYTPILSF